MSFHQSFSDFLVSRTPDFDKEILKTIVPGDGWLIPKRRRRQVEPVIRAIRKARREFAKQQKVVDSSPG